MKVSLEWIKDYVDLPSNIDINKLSYDLTMSTVEVEGITDLGVQYNHIVVGQIVDILPHPKADKLKICNVDVGESLPRDIVCGGLNLRVGMKVAVAAPGAKVRWHGEEKYSVIKETKLRGIDSFGMICAASEIGLSDLFPSAADAYILDLSDFDSAPGTNLADCLDLNDYIMEIDNKSMTNRPDLWGHYGIAREIAALYDLPLKTIERLTIDNVAEYSVEVLDKERCPRYIGVKLEGVNVKPSPFYMQSRIWRVGMRPINALVDITNYVMLATGQPTHAFDADNISEKIIVRRAEPKEHLLLLNGRDLKLDTEDLVIADSDSAVALAGVMGGSKDSILPKTERVILEVANFEPRGIRQTALRYENRTEASTRYEKGIDVKRCDIALTLLLSFFTEIYPEVSVTGFSDINSAPEIINQVDVNTTWLEKRLGGNAINEITLKKLATLGFNLTYDKDTIHVSVPSWRSTGDISIKDDIMEEIARMYGYENFESTPIVTSFKAAINQTDIDLIRRIKEYLAFRCGMQEIFTYPWMNDVYVDAILPSREGILKLSTPPSPTEGMIRSSLLPNLCAAVAKNERYFSEFSIFEEAQIAKDCDYKSEYDPVEKLPYSRRNIAGAVVSTNPDVFSLFRKTKGIVECMPRLTHMESFSFARNEKPYWADKTAWINIMLDGDLVGNIALLSKLAALKCGIKNVSVILFELDVDMLKPFSSRTNSFKPIPEYPIVNYDVSLLFDLSVKWSDILNATSNLIAKNPFIHSMSFVDEYKGDQLPKDKKSVTVRLMIGSTEKTLTSEEIEASASAVIQSLKESLGAELRLK